MTPDAAPNGSGRSEPAPQSVASAPRRRSELTLRIISSIILAAVAVATTWAGGLVFAAVGVLIAVLILLEYGDIVSASLWPAMLPVMLLALGVVVLAWIVGGAVAAAVALGVGAVAMLAAELRLTGRGWMAAGLLYAGIPMLVFSLLRGSSSGGALAVLLAFAAVWGSDVCAYIAGRTIGGPKLAPRISPKKTWAGFVGGLAGAVATAWIALWLAGLALGSVPRLMPLAAIALLLGVVSQLGDLGESWIKRRFGRKDSGTLIPGHGGVLDRLDGFLAALPVAWLIGIGVGGRAFEPGGAGEALAATLMRPY